ncbi:MAG: uracil-DNA glycosylase [Actinomycetota bacterium]
MANLTGAGLTGKPADSIEAIRSQVVRCERCPRLVEWRQAVAMQPPARYCGQNYWAGPLPGFGDPSARLLVVGLAPAAHGGNRTGRMFTGDRSGDWLFRALHKTGFANQPESAHSADGLALTDCYVSAVVRCAPPANKPTPTERDNCLPYLARELAVLKNVGVIVALGGFAWEGTLRALDLSANGKAKARPRFGHGVVALVHGYKLFGSYHPSQQNTFTGKLTAAAFDAVFEKARLSAVSRGV